MNQTKISENGNYLVFEKGYTPKFIQETISLKGLSGLMIFDVLDPLDDADFLYECSFLKALCIDTVKDFSFGFLKNLTGLKSLTINSWGKSEIDLSHQRCLDDLSLQWRKEIKGVENCQLLRRIALVDYKQTDITFIKALKKLKELVVKTSSIRKLTGLENLSELEHIFFGNCKWLQSIEALNGLKKLKSIKIEACSKIEDYENLTNLPVLEILQITNCKAIKSIKFTQSFPSLRTLNLLGNTKVMDGDLTFARGIKM